MTAAEAAGVAASAQACAGLRTIRMIPDTKNEVVLFVLLAFVRALLWAFPAATASVTVYYALGN